MAVIHRHRNINFAMLLRFLKSLYHHSCPIVLFFFSNYYVRNNFHSSLNRLTQNLHEEKWTISTSDEMEAHL